MNRIRLVTFDVTNCLLRLRRPVADAYTEVAASYGLKLKPEQHKMLGSAFKESYGDLDTRFPCFGAIHGVSEKDWWRQVMIHSFRKVGVVGQSQRLDRIFNDIYQRYATPDEWAVDEGVSRVLPELWHHGIKLGLITNWDNRIYELINWLGMSDWLHFVVNSQQARSAKPDVEIFETAGKEAAKFVEGDSLLEKWLHVGSDWKIDVQGARKAGVAKAARYSCLASDRTRRPDDMTGMDGTLEFKHLSEIHAVLFPDDQCGHKERFSTRAY